MIATLPGYARSFCMRSIHHRGTEEEPGLVLALDEAAGRGLPTGWRCAWRRGTRTRRCNICASAS